MELDQLDQSVLDRVKQNRERRMQEKEKEATDTKEQEVTPVIKFIQPSPVPRRERIRQKQREKAQEQTKEVQAVKPFTPPIEVSKERIIRNRTSPDIVMDGDTVLLTWKRRINRGNRQLQIPLQIDTLHGIVTLIYNTKSRELVIKPIG